MAGQYEDAFSPPRLRCWTVPRTPPKLPTPRPPTPFIADDRGHLLPHVPRSQVSPWGTFLGTWDMPARIPPARLDLSARSPGAAARLLREQPRALQRACNGIRTRVTGKLQEPWDMEPSGKDMGGPSGGSPHPEPPKPGDNLEGGPCPYEPSWERPCLYDPPGEGPQNPPGEGPQNPPGERPQNPPGEGSCLYDPPGEGPQNPPGERSCLYNPPGEGPQNPPGERPQNPPGEGSCLYDPPGEGPQNPPGEGPQNPPGEGPQNPSLEGSCPQNPSWGGPCPPNSPSSGPPLSC